MDNWASPFWLTVSVLFCFFPIRPVFAAPAAVFDDASLFNISHRYTRNARYELKRAVPDLRILSLGASIMSGTGSSTGDGCRKPLRDALREDGYNVDMVGSLHGGTMVDNDMEAVPGDILTQIRARIPNSIGYKPNVVIINGGVNDGVASIDIPDIGSRMNDILNDLWAGADMADTCIMLSTLIPTTNEELLENRPSINSQYTALVAQRAGEGKCIYLAEMDPGGVQWLQIDTDYVSTEIPHVHPNDAGHAKMATVFYHAIHEALDNNAIPATVPFSVGASVCDKVEGTGVDAGGLTQRGSGYDDGIYYHDSIGEGILWTATSQWDRNQWHFARLFDQNYDDLLAWISDSDTEQVYAVWANSADGEASSWVQMSDLNPDLLCDADGVFFIDMTSDGLDDLVCIDADGNAYLSVNQGDGDRAAGKSPTFVRVSDTALIKSNEGYPRERVVLADIDGDGRGDYGIIDDSGDVYFWRNGWIDPIPAYWQALGLRFSNPNLGDINGTRFEDINGDGRDDGMWVGTDGSVYTWTNSRSWLKGLEGDGLNVAWRQGFYHGESSGPTHYGVGSYLTTEETNLRGRIHFARIYGPQSDTIFGNLPLQDYVFMEHTVNLDGTHLFQMRVWKNTGAGGSKLLPDGNKYCNMVGHSNGMDDYVWAWSYGTMILYINRGKGTISDSDPDGYWDYAGVIWTPPENLNRRDLHLVDWDGDGACDLVWVNPDGGAVEVWLNTYPTTQTWDWDYIGNPEPMLACSEKRGLGIFDLAVRFADISGNGRGDYLCIKPDSTVTGFTQNDDGSWTDAGQIKVSINEDRANMRWADVNGDGKDDLLWVEKFSGDAYVWYNAGPGTPATNLGSSYVWTQQTEAAYAGNAEGPEEYWPDLDGNGRADEHFIIGTFTNEARTSLNPSCGLQDRTGDDATFDTSVSTLLAGVGGLDSSFWNDAGTGTGSGGSGGSGTSTTVPPTTTTPPPTSTSPPASSATPTVVCTASGSTRKRRRQSGSTLIGIIYSSR